MPRSDSPQWCRTDDGSIHTRRRKIAALVSNAGYSGPLKPKSYIRDFFSEAEERETALDGLYAGSADWNNLMTQHSQLLKNCHDLLKYALPEYVSLKISVRTYFYRIMRRSTVKTQLITFKVLVTVITRYVGIRRLFLRPKGSKQPSMSSPCDFEALWNRPHQKCDEEWMFYRDFALYCLTDGPLTELVESECPSELGYLKPLEDNWNKDRIESLLSFCGSVTEFLQRCTPCTDQKLVAMTRILTTRSSVPFGTSLVFWSCPNLGD